MLDVSPELFDAIDRSVEVRLFSRVVAEWELNSYSDYAISFPPSVDENIFPTEDIMNPRRPVAGLPKIVAGAGRITSPTSRPRYRIPSDESQYKYYSTDALSDPEGNIDFSGEIIYDDTINCNRIVLGFETAYAYPEEVLLYVKYEVDSEEWVSIGSYQVDEQTGLVLADFNNGLWSPRESDGEDEEEVIDYSFDSISGIKVSVSKLSEGDQRLSIIQVSPRLVLDFTDKVIRTSLGKVREQISMFNPFGLSTSSTSSVSLSNHDKLFSPENEESDLYGLIDKNVKVDVWTMVDTRKLKVDFVPEDFEYVKQITFFVDEWSIGSDSTVEISGRDRSKFLQEAMVENSLYRNKPVGEVVADIIERSGIVDYDIRIADGDDHVVPYLFFKEDKSVWETLQDIAISTQSVFYFDENDSFIWESKDYLWSKEEIDYELRSQADDDKLANVVNFDFQFQVDANRVNVTWIPTDTPKSSGENINNVLWEENESVVLGASVLPKDFLSEEEYFVMSSEDARFFPDKGVVNINGEYVRYSKEDPEGEESDDTITWMKATERGIYNSSVQDHYVEPSTNFWSFYSTDENEIFEGNSSSARYYIENSLLKVVMPEEKFSKVAHFVGGEEDDQYGIYGCRIRFPLSGIEDEIPSYEGDGAAGIFIHSDGQGGGYYFEIITSPFAFRSEISEREARVWKFNEEGIPVIQSGYIPVDNIETLDEDEFFRIAGSNIVIAPGDNYDIHVVVKPIPDFSPDGESDGESGQYYEYRFFVNGQPVISYIDDEFFEGKWGVFARSKTLVEFEYLYAIDRRGVETDISSSAHKIRDYVRGGFKSNILSSFLTEHNQLRSDIIIEDFGPWIQEVKEFDVEYEVSPALTSNIFLSRFDEVEVIARHFDQFSARFAIANKSRSFIVVAGSDPITGTSMKIFVYGIPVIQREENLYTEEDLRLIRRRGLSEVEIKSSLIQTQEHASQIALWAVTRWSGSNDIINMTTIVNPSIQVGDLVSVNIPEANIFPETHLYHVIECSSTIGSGAEMTLVLKRAYL